MKSSVDINKAIEALTSNEIIHIEEKYKDIEYLSKLNSGQKVAATRKNGNFLVIAGPGTGKTHTLVYRVIHMIRTGVDPKAIVIITFTRKAGNELKNRLNYMLPNTSLGFVGTFHGFANHISQLIGSASPISKFRLLDSEDDIQVHNLVLVDFPNFKKQLRAKRLQKVISYCCNTRLSVTDYITKYDLHDLMDDMEAIEAYKAVYEKYKVEHMLANYDDMITLMSQYLEKDDGMKITAPYEYLMIDEYQDTNKMQLDFIKKLKLPNVMAIGDDFQGIYAFRGADHRIILNFYNDFEEAKMIKLTKNYRSNEDIVGWVNATIERSTLGYQKALKSASKSGGKAQIISGESLDQHKHFILQKVKEHPDKKHALIYRYNKNRTVFEKALIAENIDYTVYGGIRLLERKHIKDVLAYLMVYLNRRDIVSYNRILTMLPGVGAKTAKKLIMNDLSDISHLKGQKLQLVGKIKEILSGELGKADLYDQICSFYFSIFEYVESEYYSKEDIEADFKLVKDLMITYESLENFIINIILDPVVDLNKGKNPKVVLTTIHSAKGLEFDYVYYFHTHDWYKNYDLEMLEEDRRLFYVGISRAKEYLHIFDHTEVKRSFEDVLRDFDSSIRYQEPVDVYKNLGEASRSDNSAPIVDKERIDSSDMNEGIAITRSDNVITIDFAKRRKKR